MSADVIVEFTVKDPELYREKYASKAGLTAKEHGGETLATATGKSCPGTARSRQGH